MSCEYVAPNAVADAVWRACISEVEALKPGNVSVYSAGHGMQVDDFVVSARCIAEILGEPGLTLGERILKSVDATVAAVGCNTNLGIVLLCAPLTHASVETYPGTSLRSRVSEVLSQLTVTDTEQVFHAICLARPAGLGHSERHDVRRLATAPLLEVMAEAEHRDRIAYQYVHDFTDVFDIGLAAFQDAAARWAEPAWAAVAVYLRFLARFPDTHIERKLGAQIAEEVRRSASELLSLLETVKEPEDVVEPLLAFDRSLKQRGINPGTSADLTVATVLAGHLERLAENDIAARPERAAVGTRESEST